MKTPLRASSTPVLAQNKSMEVPRHLSFDHLREITRRRRADYASADSLCTKRTVRRAFSMWRQHWVFSRLLQERLQDVIKIIRRQRLRTYLYTWKRRLQGIKEKHEHAQMVLSWNIMNRVCNKWKTSMQRRHANDASAGALQRYACLTKYWTKWVAVLRLRRATMEDRKNQELAINYHSGLLRRLVLRTLKDAARQRKLQNEKAEREFIHGWFSRIFRKWVRRAKRTSMEARARGFAHRRGALRLKTHAFSEWKRLMILHAGAVQREAGVVKKTLESRFTHWREKYVKRHLLRRKVEAIRRWRNLLATERCRRLLRGKFNLVWIVENSNLP